MVDYTAFTDLNVMHDDGITYNRVLANHHSAADNRVLDIAVHF